MTAATSITVRVPLKIQRRAGRKTVVMPVPTANAAIPTRAEPTLVKALARAFRYQRLLDEGRYALISEMAAAERIERGYLGTLLRLTLLAGGRYCPGNRERATTGWWDAATIAGAVAGGKRCPARSARS